MKTNALVIVTSLLLLAIRSALAHGPIYEGALLEIGDDPDGKEEKGLVHLNLFPNKPTPDKVVLPDSLIEVGDDRACEEPAGLVQVGCALTLGSNTAGVGGLSATGGGGNILEGVTGILPISGIGSGDILQGITGGELLQGISGGPLALLGGGSILQR